jgi:hypothetical protein
MAEKDSKTNITHADFVGKIVKDPKSPPDTILLTGYLGKSSEEGHTRLYFDPELKSYVEIPNEAILHSQQIPQEQSGLGGSNVWIASDAELIHGKVGPSRTKAKFFEGPIGAAAAGAGAGVAGGFPPHTRAPELCPQTLLPPCPTALCTQVFFQCATPLHECPPPPPTPQCTHACPSQHPGICHTPVALCLNTAPPQCVFTTASGPHCPTNGPAACPPTPGCPTHHPGFCRTPVVLCLNTAPPQCVFTTASGPHCPVATGAACPSALGCPSGPVCGGGGIPVGGDPAAAMHAAGAGQAAFAATLFCPSHPAVCQQSPFCPSPICPSHLVICPPSPFCPTLPHICLTNPVICGPSAFCPSPFCPTPGCHTIVCPQSPFCPVSAGCPFNPGGGGNPVF